MQGIYQAFRQESNLRIHFVAAALAAGAGFVFKLSAGEWAVLLLTITLVIFAELINTALEANVNLATKKHQPEAKLAKDAAAGAVLLTALNAVLIGLLIFVPKIWEFFRR
ncbi:MAG: diacylglycerol kinase family protein [Candidatus Margulisbacteria bacterium]|jgi:diacylglycerol kinase|nr:diacylglycerol kinase family protein [Candidatus Margulisiibacteriota bacterium]